MKFRHIAWLMVFALLGNPVLAAHPAQQVVKNTTDRVLERVRDNQQELKEHPEGLYRLAQDLVFPHFDFNTMSRWVLGRYWREASAAQRQRFIEEFQTLLIRTYARALLNYTDETISYQSVTENLESGLVTVKSKVEQSTAQSIPVNYTMHRADGEWKVIDVSVNGVSLVATYRGSFAAQVRRYGLAGLIEKLSAQNARSLVANS